MKTLQIVILIIVLLIATLPSVILAQFAIPNYNPNKEIPEEVCRECLIGNELPEWVLKNPETGKLDGELLDISLNKGKGSDTCQYTMRSRNNPKQVWNCAGLSNSARELKRK